MRKKWLWAAGLVLAVAALIVVNIYKLNKTVDVDWMEAAKGSLKEQVFASGAVESTRVTPLVFDASGQIAELNVKTGDKVTVGQTLVTLDVSDLKRQYEEGLNNLKLLQVQKEQQRKAAFDQAKLDKQAGKEPADPPDLRTFDLQIANAQEDLDRLKEQMDASTLAAPYDGVVTETDLYVGQPVQPGAKAMTIMDNHSLQVRANVNQLDANKVKAGMKATVTGDAFEGEYSAVISKVSPVAKLAGPTATDPSVEILAQIDKADDALRSGYNATVAIPIRHSEHILVPQAALIRQGDKAFVLEAKDGKLVKKAVTIGDENDEQVEVVQGLAAGEKIAADASGLREGQKVKPQ